MWCFLLFSSISWDSVWRPELRSLSTKLLLWRLSSFKQTAGSKKHQQICCTIIHQRSHVRKHSQHSLSWNISGMFSTRSCAVAGVVWSMGSICNTQIALFDVLYWTLMTRFCTRWSQAGCLNEICVLTARHIWVIVSDITPRHILNAHGSTSRILGSGLGGRAPNSVSWFPSGSTWHGWNGSTAAMSTRQYLSWHHRWCWLISPICWISFLSTVGSGWPYETMKPAVDSFASHGLYG